MSAYKALVAEVTEYLARPGILRDGLDPKRYAEIAISETEIHDGELSFEIPGRDTPTGNPNSVSFDATAYAAELDAETEK